MIALLQKGSKPAVGAEAQDIIIWEILTQEKKCSFPLVSMSEWPKFV
jgi:hypothetical protein